MRVCRGCSLKGLFHRDCSLNGYPTGGILQELSYRSYHIESPLVTAPKSPPTPWRRHATACTSLAIRRKDPST